MNTDTVYTTTKPLMVRPGMRIICRDGIGGIVFHKRIAPYNKKPNSRWYRIRRDDGYLFEVTLAGKKWSTTGKYLTEHPLDIVQWEAEAQQGTDAPKANMPMDCWEAWVKEEIKRDAQIEAQRLAAQEAAAAKILGGFDEDEPAPAPAPTAPLSTCAIAPTETGHKLTLQVESDADLHSLTTWLLECLESLPA